VRLSDSFRATLAELAEDLRAELVEWRPAEGDGPPPAAACLLFLAGGAESAALDQLSGLPPGGAPRYVVGASPDHRLAAAAIQRGARDYFALPDDLGLLRRSLERERREAEARSWGRAPRCSSAWSRAGGWRNTATSRC